MNEKPFLLNVEPNEMGMVQTPYSKTWVRFDERWNSKVWMKEYQRYRRREAIGLKQRPRVADDGSRICEGATDRPNYYQPVERIRCEVCQKDIIKGFYARHLFSSSHEKKNKFFSSQGINNDEGRQILSGSDPEGFGQTLD